MKSKNKNVVEFTGVYNNPVQNGSLLKLDNKVILTGYGTILAGKPFQSDIMFLVSIRDL